MTAKEILAEMKPLGSESYKRMLFKNYRVKEPCFGVKISDLKRFQRRIRKDYRLALDLYNTGNYDAMYLAGLIADDRRMSKSELQRWVEKADAGALPGSTVAWVAAGSLHGWDLALEWIESPKNHIAESGWSTLASLVALKDDSELQLPKLKQLMTRVRKEIRNAPDTVRYAMNRFIIAVGAHVSSLSEFALETAESVGMVTADLGNNNCQIPFAPDCIRQLRERGLIGRKRKTVKC